MRSGGRNNQKVKKKDSSKLAVLAVMLVILTGLIVFLPKEPMVVARNAQGGASDARGLVLTEIMSDNASALPDENGAFGDWVEIQNTAEAPINMKNIGLSNRSDKIQFLFPDKIGRAHV